MLRDPANENVTEQNRNEIIKAYFHYGCAAIVSDSVTFDVGRCASWTKNEIDFARWWRLQVDRDMVDRADMIKELAVIRDGALCWSEADFTPEDAQALIVSLSVD